jgi:type II secretory pathway pseudopilin PulG
LTVKNIVIGILVILLAAAGGAVVIQQQAQVKLRQEKESLRQQLDQLARLQADNEQLSNRLAQANAAVEAQTAELLKLRNEVGMLRKQSAQIAELQRKNEQLNDALNSTHKALLAKPPPQTSPNVNALVNAAADAATGPDLGAVQLVNQTPSRFDLGGGKTCTLTPTIDAYGNYDIKVIFESQKSDGQTEQLGTGEVTVSPGRAVRLISGDSSVGFTPTVNPAPQSAIH